MTYLNTGGLQLQFGWTVKQPWYKWHLRKWSKTNTNKTELQSLFAVTWHEGLVQISIGCDFSVWYKLLCERERERNRGNSPLGEKRIDDSVSQRIDGQLWDPLEILSTANRRRQKQNLIPTLFVLKIYHKSWDREKVKITWIQCDANMATTSSFV